MEKKQSANRMFTARALLLAAFAIYAGLAAAEEKPSPGGNADASEAVKAVEAKLAAQQAQIEKLTRAVELLTQRLNETAQALPPKTDHSPALGQVSSLAPVIPVGVNRAAARAAKSTEPQGERSEGPSPVSFRIGDADFTPGGFMDFTAAYRTTASGGIATSFGAIPFSNSPAGRLSELRLSAQNSRLSLTVTSKAGANNVKGYVESDFLGLQPPNGAVTSNSDSFRLRLYWLDLTRGKFEILAGQSWSLLNPNRNGLSAVPSNVFYSQVEDANYHVGLTWARQSQIRFIYHPTAQLTAGISLENPQQYVGGAVVLPASFNASQVDQGTNPNAPNLHPDVIAKVAYDPQIGGKHMHVEAAALVSSFRVFNAATNSTATATGGGGSINANLELVKDFHFIVNTFYSDGGGRYIFGLGPDFIIKPDAAPSLVHSSSAIVGFEHQATPATMLYGYYGGAYFQRNTAIDPVTKKFLGFGFPGSPSSSQKSVQEGTVGVIQTFWKNPRYGALQLITQYSYLTRSPWSGAPGTPKDAHTSMGFANLRYVLP